LVVVFLPFLCGSNCKSHSSSISKFNTEVEKAHKRQEESRNRRLNNILAARTNDVDSINASERYFFDQRDEYELVFGKFSEQTEKIIDSCNGCSSVEILSQVSPDVLLELLDATKDFVSAIDIVLSDVSISLRMREIVEFEKTTVEQRREQVQETIDVIVEFNDSWDALNEWEDHFEIFSQNSQSISKEYSCSGQELWEFFSTSYLQEFLEITNNAIASYEFFLATPLTSVEEKDNFAEVQGVAIIVRDGLVGELSRR